MASQRGIEKSFGRISYSGGTAIAGNAWTKFVPSGAVRSGVEIHNGDSTIDLWVRAQNVGVAAPTTFTTVDKDWVIPPKSTLPLAYSVNQDIYVCNGSGAATTINAVIKEVSYEGA